MVVGQNSAGNVPGRVRDSMTILMLCARAVSWKIISFAGLPGVRKLVLSPDCLVGALVLECSKRWEAGEKFCLERAVCILADFREFIDEVVESLPFHRGPILGGESNCPVKTVPVAVDFMSLAAKWFYVCSQVCIFMKLAPIFGPKGINSGRLVSCPVSPDSFW